MPRIVTLADAERALFAFIPATLRNQPYTLDRIRALLDYLHNPQQKLRVVHIAGTSGKTSTAYFIRALLQAAGKRTGLTVSPHIHTITERVQLNGQPLTERQFVAYINDFLPLVAASGLKPSYFEVLMALAYWVFAKQKVDYAVIETGLGGLLDGSNVARRADKLCVISDIGLDHTEKLGKSIVQIARNKAGIIQPGNHVIIQQQSVVAMRVVRRVAVQQGGTVEVARGTGAIQTDLPLFQQRNWTLALAAYAYVAGRDGLPVLTATQLAYAASQQPPGRLEVWQLGNKKIIIDGAHNPQKLHALYKTLAAQGITQAAVLANFVQAPAQKTQSSLKALQPLAAHLIVPEFVVMQDVGKKSVPADQLVATAVKMGYPNVTAQPNLARAFALLLTRPEPVLLVTGSLYLVSQILPLLASKQMQRSHI